MRKVLFLLSPEVESSIEKILSAYPFSDYSVQGIFLYGCPVSEKTFPFPCYILDSEKSKKSEHSAYPLIHYPDVLKMIFDADTVISYS